MALLPRASFGGNFYPGISPATVPWTNGIVPYEFTNTLTAAMQQTYLDGLREWELAANVKFIPRTNQTRWVLFTFNSNGFNNVSTGYSPQVVSIASLSRAQVAHEMGHSFGFTHENIRPDQTNHLTILTNNIFNPAGNIGSFVIDPNSVTNGNYDFESVMHLGWDFAAVQPGVLATQQPKPPYSPRYQFRMGNLTLSPGDRAALQFLYGPPAVPPTNVVTTTADSGPGSLRAAMYYVADHPGSVVQFNIPTSDPGYGSGVFNIHLSGHLPVLAADGMVIDGSTQPGFTSKPLIVVDASQILPETFTSDTLLIYSANNLIKNISLQGFNWNGVTLLYADATNNTIAGCWIGLDSTGSNAAPNVKQGILIDSGASRNTIGGTNVLSRNVLSGNREYGIWISGSDTTGNVILGNYIGTDASGSFAISNGFGGVILTGATRGNTVGGTNPDGSGRNVLSGNISAGLWITGAGVANNLVQGNFVGLNASGTAAISNTFAGIYVLSGAQSNLIANNVISGNFSEGLRLGGAGVTANVVRGNFIGTDASGMNPLPNNFAGLTIFSGAASNTVGGTIPGARNIISGNGSYGLAIANPGTDGNVVQGNYVGLGPDGATAVPNFHGVLIASGAIGNLVGGSSSATRNVISGNNASGVYLADAGTSGNLVQGNFIGPDAGGNATLGNGWSGVQIFGGPTANLIGGISAGNANLIAGNQSDGVQLSDAATTNNSIRGNSIFNNSGVGIALNNDANLNAAAPTLTSAVLTTNTTITGSLTSLVSTTFQLDFYSDAPPASGAEATTYLGSRNVTTSASGTVNFTNSLGALVPAGRVITATVTDPTGNTSPLSSGVAVTATSTVSDGIPDAWRTRYFGGTGTTTNAQSCVTCDADGDGRNNRDEFLSGTNPTNSTSILQVMARVPDESGNVGSFLSATGIVYRLEFRDDLRTGAWSILADQIIGTGGNILINDPNAAPLPKRFYRAEVLW